MMKNNFSEYLIAMHFPPNFYDRVNYIINFYTIQLKISVDDIFVSERINQEGERIYESLWLLNKNQLMEAKNFLSEDNFDCFNFMIRNWRILKKDYDSVKEPNVNSRMQVELGMGVGVGETGTLRASRENCKFLLDIFTRYIIGKQGDFCQKALP